MILSTYEQKHDTIQLSCEIAHYNMRQLSIHWTPWGIYLHCIGHLFVQYGTSIYTIWDISQNSIGHLSIQYGTYIYVQYGTSLNIIPDIYLYSMGHLSIKYGHLPFQYVTYIHRVWSSPYAVLDIYIYNMGHMYIYDMGLSI